ncbi:hypothetical protein PRVXT_001593 [Proteinivorax tanatarense]|uniref:Uncharacterized protein n=1 Tax=Proteinivorax tanatarense TaxID=1260629 RepID=A0AAU7VIC4_9FIRM
MPKKQNCFAYKKNGCKALRVKECEGCICPFFKTKGEYKRGKKEVKKRINSYDEPERSYLIDAYYGGKLKV